MTANPWHCDLQLCDVFNVISRTTCDVQSQCSSPESVRGRPMLPTLCGEPFSLIKASQVTKTGTFNGPLGAKN